MRKTFLLLSTFLFLTLIGFGSLAYFDIQSDVRESKEEVARHLLVQEGGAVADVGAGDGDWTLDLARRVGGSGHVYSTEVDDAKLKKIRSKASQAGLTNVTTVLGNQKETGLPHECCDAILLRHVYHHFTEPQSMIDGFFRALRPGGRMVIIEFGPGRLRPVQGVPKNRGGHGVEADLVVQEMNSGGFELVDRIAPWDGKSDHYCLVFRRLPPP